MSFESLKKTRIHSEPLYYLHYMCLNQRWFYCFHIAILRHGTSNFDFNFESAKKNKNKKSAVKVNRILLDLGWLTRWSIVGIGSTSLDFEATFSLWFVRSYGIWGCLSMSHFFFDSVPTSVLESFTKVKCICFLAYVIVVVGNNIGPVKCLCRFTILNQSRMFVQGTRAPELFTVQTFEKDWRRELLQLAMRSRTRWTHTWFIFAQFNNSHESHEDEM